MLARLIQFALTQRLLMLLAVLMLIGSGWYAFRNTPIDAFPDVSTTQVKIIVNGVPEKGMITWRGVLRPSQIEAVASYIQKFHGTSPPNPKPPANQAPVDTGPSLFE